MTVWLSVVRVLWCHCMITCRHSQLFVCLPARPSLWISHIVSIPPIALSLCHRIMWLSLSHFSFHMFNIFTSLRCLVSLSVHSSFTLHLQIVSLSLRSSHCLYHRFCTSSFQKLYLFHRRDLNLLFFLLRPSERVERHSSGASTSEWWSQNGRFGKLYFQWQLCQFEALLNEKKSHFNVLCIVQAVITMCRKLCCDHTSLVEAAWTEPGAACLGWFELSPRPLARTNNQPLGHLKDVVLNCLQVNSGVDHHWLWAPSATIIARVLLTSKFLFSKPKEKLASCG